MKYPPLKNAPIKETVFAVSYEDIVDSECYDKFCKLSEIKSRFSEIKEAADTSFQLTTKGISFSSNSNGFDLKNENEILRIRQGQFSYHCLHKYFPFEEILNSFSELWCIFDTITKDELKIRNCFVRYINLIEFEEEDQPSRLVQLYPKYSSDRNIKGFQNSVKFTYKDYTNSEINIVTSKLNKSILIDITVSTLQKIKQGEKIEDIILPLQEIKNKAFFDSITARTLLKYLEFQK